MSGLSLRFAAIDHGQRAAEAKADARCPSSGLRRRIDVSRPRTGRRRGSGVAPARCRASTAAPSPPASPACAARSCRGATAAAPAPRNCTRRLLRAASVRAPARTPISSSATSATSSRICAACSSRQIPAKPSPRSSRPNSAQILVPATRNRGSSPGSTDSTKLSPRILLIAPGSISPRSGVARAPRRAFQYSYSSRDRGCFIVSCWAACGTRMRPIVSKRHGHPRRRRGRRPTSRDHAHLLCACRALGQAGGNWDRGRSFPSPTSGRARVGPSSTGTASGKDPTPALPENGEGEQEGPGLLAAARRPIAAHRSSNVPRKSRDSPTWPDPPSRYSMCPPWSCRSSWCWSSSRPAANGC